MAGMGSGSLLGCKLGSICSLALVVLCYFLILDFCVEAKGPYVRLFYPPLKPAPKTRFRHHSPVIRHGKKLPLRAYFEIRRPNNVFRKIKKSRPHFPLGPPQVDHVIIHDGPPPPRSRGHTTSSHEYTTSDDVIIHDDQGQHSLPPSSAFDVVNVSEDDPSSPYGELTIHNVDNGAGSISPLSSDYSGSYESSNLGSSNLESYYPGSSDSGVTLRPHITSEVGLTQNEPGYRYQSPKLQLKSDDGNGQNGPYNDNKLDKLKESQDSYNPDKSTTSSQVTLQRDPIDPNKFSIQFDSKLSFAKDLLDSKKSYVELINEAYERNRKVPLSNPFLPAFEKPLYGELSFGGGGGGIRESPNLSELISKHLLTKDVNELLAKELLAKELLTKELIAKDQLAKQQHILKDIIAQNQLTRDLLLAKASRDQHQLSKDYLSKTLLENSQGYLTSQSQNLQPVPLDPISKVIKNVRLNEYISVRRDEGSDSKILTLSSRSKTKFLFDAVKEGSRIYIGAKGNQCVFGVPTNGKKATSAECSNVNPLMQWNFVSIQRDQFWIQQKGTNYCLQPSEDLSYQTFIEMKPCDLYESHQLWEIDNAIPKDLFNDPGSDDNRKW